MQHYVHHVPGRLRVRSPDLKRNEPVLRRARMRLEAVPGVDAVEIRPVTGSLCVRYDRTAVSGDHLLEAIARAGLVDLGRVVGLDDVVERAARRLVGGASQKLAKAAAGALVGRFARGPALSLLTALLQAAAPRRGESTPRHPEPDSPYCGAPNRRVPIV